MEIEIAQLHMKTSQLLGVDFLPAEKEIENCHNINRSNTLEELHKLHDIECEHCTNTTGYTQTVFGDGNPNADLMFIGEAPGAEEDEKGIPFVGPAGHKLNQIIESINMNRVDVYITHVVKCRPSENRTPLPAEVNLCGTYLKEQIRLVKPKVIVCLGAPATKYILNTTAGITRLRGSWGLYESIPVMPTFHPAYLLRNYTKETRQAVWSDMQSVKLKLSQ